ncbi:MAG TPA: SpoIIE family protein phosphatase, partial [Bacteroidia bacterium]
DAIEMKKEGEVKDGMDISLTSITQLNEEDFVIHWAGANNPLWYVLGSAPGTINEIKANKQPIGKYAEQTPFTTHELNLKKGDSLYMYTDGYADQFGGAKGKKFKYKQLEQLLLANVKLPLPDQQQLLDEQFTGWRGNLEQVDDVCIIGIRL